MQIALAIKDEVEDLEAGKIRVPKITQVKSLRLLEAFARLKVLGCMADEELSRWKLPVLRGFRIEVPLISSERLRFLLERETEKLVLP